MRTVSAADANRQFSKLLREVAAGGSVIVTSRGRPIARMEPVVAEDDARALRERAWERLSARLDAQPTLNLGKFSRDEAYE